VIVLLKNVGIFALAQMCRLLLWTLLGFGGVRQGTLDAPKKTSEVHISSTDDKFILSILMWLSILMRMKTNVLI
jgi:hypothetical protein